MTLDTALANRFTEMRAFPPQDIYNSLKFQMVQQKRVMVFWHLGPNTARMDVCDETQNWRQLFDGRNG